MKKKRETKNIFFPLAGIFTASLFNEHYVTGLLLLSPYHSIKIIEGPDNGLVGISLSAPAR